MQIAPTIIVGNKKYIIQKEKRNMKKFFAALLVAILIVGIIPMSVSAAGTASVSASPSSVNRGGTFTVTVAVSGVTDAKNIAAMVSYEKTAFELTGGSWLISGGMLESVDKNTGAAVYAYQNATALSGNIVTFNF